MLKYVRGLKFEETPKYDMLLKLIKVAGKRCGVKPDTAFDWIERSLQDLERRESGEAEDTEEKQRESFAAAGFDSRKSSCDTYFPILIAQ